MKPNTCPDCERPNQFGELCDDCRESAQQDLLAREEQDETFADPDNYSAAFVDE
jgi:hypothetical protein